VHPDRLWWLSHGPESLHVLESLHDHGSFEKEKHKEVEQGVVPVLVQEPQQRAKELEDEEGSDDVLLVEVQEIWDRDVHLVIAPNQVSATFLLLLHDALRVLIKLNGLLHRIRDSLEYLFVIAPDHSFFHNFQAVNCLKLAWRYLNTLAEPGHDQGFDGLLLLVLELDPNICALLNIANFGIGEKHIDVGTPKIDEEEKRVESDGQHEAEHRD
jgi:hypothetical protein